MTIGELVLYINLRSGQCDTGPLGNPFQAACSDYRYAHCAAGNLAGGDTDCTAYAYPSDPVEGLTIDAALALVAVVGPKVAPALLEYLRRNPSQISRAQVLAQAVARGRAFEGSVLQALRVAGNTANYLTRLGTTVRPDSLMRGVLEVKDRISIVATPQIRGLADLAMQTGQEFNLIVSGRTQYISSTVQALVANTGGTIVRFDPASGYFLPWP